MQENTLYLRKFTTSGVKGIQNKVVLDLTPSKDRTNIENVEFFGLDRSKYDFGALKTAFIIGQNGSGKSSLLESLFQMLLYLKNPFLSNNLLSNKNFLLNYTNAEEGKGIFWDAEFVFKDDGYIYLFRFIGEDIGTEKTKETLKFRKTKDGQSVSNWKTIFTSNLTTINKVGTQDVQLNKVHGNGMKSLDFIGHRDILEKEFPNEHKTIMEFIRNKVDAVITREEATGRTIGLHDLQKLPTLHRKKLLLLYKLFDHKLEDIKNINGTIVIDYRIAKNVIKSMSIHEFMAITSNGGSRMTELVSPIYDAILANKFLLIDELDRSLHTNLSEFITAFIMDHIPGQKILTTHNLNILNTKILSIRRDQISVITNNNEKHTIHRGHLIAENNKQQFYKEYIKQEFLDSPNENIREKVWDEFEEYEI